MAVVATAAGAMLVGKHQESSDRKSFENLAARFCAENFGGILGCLVMSLTWLNECCSDYS